MSVWSFISTLVRSLLAFLSFPRRRRTTPDTSTATRLRPILLTPRSIALSRIRSLSPAHIDNPTAEPQRTHDAELGLLVEHPELPPANATSLRECTPDTSATGSLYVSPLTPPDRCYLAPLPSTTDCPYTEPWPTGAPLGRGKSRLPGSPLKVSININRAFPEPRVAPIGSPPPGRWSPLHIWTSTPSKNDNAVVPDLVLSSFEHREDSSALANLSHAIITRSQSSIQPYDNASNSSVSSPSSPFVDIELTRHDPIHDHHRALACVPRSKHQPYPRFHHPDAYAYTWRRHGARFPGKAKRPLGHSRSHSHMDITTNEWFDADAYASSPVAALSPPLGDSATEDEDEDEMPLCRLRERLANRNTSVGATLGLGVPIVGGGGADTRKMILSPRTRRMSEGCLLALSETTPTRVGVNARSGRQVLDGDGDAAQDWLEVLSLRFSSEHKGASESSMAAPSVDAVAV